MFVLLALGLGLALLLVLAYGALRASPWSPHDGGALAWARVHGFATALVAAVAVLTAAWFLQSLREDHGPEQYSLFVKPGAEAVELPASSVDPGTALLAASLPGLWLLAVYAIAQRTWPRATGPLRTARLDSRRATDLLPPVLTWVVMGIVVAALAAVILAWSAPGAAPLYLSYATENSTLESFAAGTRPGSEFAPWLLLALTGLVAAAAAVTAVVSRRPALTGLTGGQDHAVRRIAVHRALRTTAAGALVILVVAMAGWADGTLQSATREAYGPLDAMAAAYADGITLDDDGAAHHHVTGPPPTDLPPGLYTLAFCTPVAAVLGMLVLLLWSPAGVREPVRV